MTSNSLSATSFQSSLAVVLGFSVSVQSVRSVPVTLSPTYSPSVNPSVDPSKAPIPQPSLHPFNAPTLQPSAQQQLIATNFQSKLSSNKASSGIVFIGVGAGGVLLTALFVTFWKRRAQAKAAKKEVPARNSIDLADAAAKDIHGNLVGKMEKGHLHGSNINTGTIPMSAIKLESKPFAEGGRMFS